MKLRRKLMLGFVEVPWVTAATSIILNTSIKDDVTQINQIY